MLFRLAPEVSDGVGARLPGADADGFLDIENENLAVADAARARSLLDGFDRSFNQILGNDDLDLHFGQEINDILGAAIKFGMALLPPEALGFGDGNALDPHFL